MMQAEIWIAVDLFADDVHEGMERFAFRTTVFHTEEQANAHRDGVKKMPRSHSVVTRHTLRWVSLNPSN
jgi:hypothetical protein